VKLFRKILTIIFILLVISIPFIIPRIVKINKVTCESQFGVCDQEIENKLNSLSNSSLFLVKRNINDYLTNNYLVRDFSMQYKALSSLKVNLVVEKAKFCLKSEDYEVFAFIDGNGEVLELKEICNLPFVNIDTKIPNVGEKIGSDLLSGLNLINQLFISYNIREGNIVSNSLEVYFPDGYKVILPLDKDIQVLLGALRLIISRLNSSQSESRIIEGRIDVIDLRYQNPVLR